MRQRHILRDAVKKHPLNMFFLLSFFLGVLCMNLWREHQVSVMIALQQFYQWQGNGVEVALGDLFVFLLQERGLLFALLVFFGAGKYGKMFHGLFVTYLGFGLGLIFASFLLVFGTIGLLLFAASLFPQILLYLPVYLLLLKTSGLWQKQREGKTEKFSSKEWGLLCCFFVILFLVFLLGVFLEAYVNPVVLEKIGSIVAW